MTVAVATKTIQPVNAEMSVRINAARLVCVMLMMYVHVPTGEGSVSVMDISGDIRIDHWLETIMIEGPGRASAALLSVVSGYLAALTLLRRQTGAIGLYQRRFKSIVLPMICWAVLTCAIYLLLGQRDALVLATDSSWLDKLNMVLFLTEAPNGPTLHLGFLRDLFVCVLLSPLLLVAVRRVPFVTIFLLLMVYLFEHSGQLVIILRPLVIFGFSLGMLLALRRLPLDYLDPYFGWFLSLAGVFAVLIAWTDAGMFVQANAYLATYGVSLKESILYPLCRLFGSLAIWTLLSVASIKTMQRYTARFSNYLFAAFCSHFLVLTVLFNGFWLPIFGDRDAYGFLLWFVAAPAVSMFVAIVMVNLAAVVYSPLAVLMTGGRVPNEGAVFPGKIWLAGVLQRLHIKKTGNKSLPRANSSAIEAPRS